MATVEIVDETVIRTRREVLAAVLADRRRWAAWWPELHVTLAADRGVDGAAWSVAGVLVGSSSVRLVVQESAVVVHYELSADPTAPGSTSTVRRLPDSPRGRREAASLHRRQVMAWKAAVWSIKDEVEGLP